ncbi:MAG: LPS-assembly protein LptD [Candidimonas sp.]|nr:MAG: LPS-assembly protein LptD [Candidimonas sp.]
MSVFLTADKIQTESNGEVVLTGSAEVRRIDSVVKGDRIDYQRNTGEVQVHGNGLIMRDASIVTGPSLRYNVNSKTGEVSDPNFWLGANAGSGKAAQADILDSQDMRLHDVVYAGCPCADPPWYIESPRVDLHFQENEGVAHNGVLYFKGVPLLASPYLSFPIRKERKSGFLIPTYGVSSNTGVELSLPYYLNLAPNYDATLTPRLMSKRGAQLGAEFRYLGANYHGELSGTYLPRDAITRDPRWMYIAQHYQDLGNGLNLSLDLRRVSDDNYFRDFSTFGLLNETTTSYLPSVATLTSGGHQYWYATLQSYTYQTLQDSTSTYLLPPYDKLPELHFNASRYNWSGFDVQSDNYVTRFQSPVYRGALYNSSYAQAYGVHTVPNGTRFLSYDTVAYPITRAGWYITPKAGLSLAQYNTNWYSIAADQGFPATQSRVLPIVSVDSGMTFERNTTLFGNDTVQTLEPRLYYLWVPYRNQSQIPIYDTALATFNFTQAFSDNIFSGWDRVANANQITAGLTSRWLDADTGFERLSLSAAQRYYFVDQRVTLPGETADARTARTSDYLVGMNAALTDKFNVQFNAQYNPHTHERDQLTTSFRWEPKRLATLSVGYRYERDPAQLLNPAVVNVPGYVDNSRNQATVSGQWPITNKWYVMGRYDYSFQGSRNTQSIAGVEYKGDCCWTARVVFERYAVSSADVNSAVFFQLELSGLGSLGTDPMSLLRDRIIGYQPVTPPIPEKTSFERYE